MSSDINVVWSGIEHSSSCILSFMNATFECSLGKNGVISSDLKMEGDGFTPSGSFPLRRAFYREDKIADTSFIPSFLNAEAIKVNYGWCDESYDELYNQFIHLPYNASHERLWLDESSFYDLFAVIGYNDDPIVPNAGSAIFFHVTESFSSTAGCVAMKLSDLQWVIERIEPNTLITIS